MADGETLSKPTIEHFRDANAGFAERADGAERCSVVKGSREGTAAVQQFLR